MGEIYADDPGSGRVFSGEKKMRQIVEDYEGADFIIMNGNRTMIKRKSFERFLDSATAV